MFVVLTTWQRGREIVTSKREELEGPLSDFIEEIRDPKQPISRSPRTGIFLDANPETTPLALRANVEHNCVLHENVVIVSVQTLNVPHVEESERVTVDDLGYRDDGITHVTARFGFQDDLDVPATLRAAAERLEREADFEQRLLLPLAHLDHRHRRRPGWRSGARSSSSRSPATPPAPCPTSTCPTSGRW